MPDAITFAKGLANGLAIGGVIAKPELMGSLTVNSIYTSGDNLVAMSAGLAAIHYLLDHGLQANAARIGDSSPGSAPSPLTAR
ncbi:aminotransferase class III-fold pyridoxal phosphate-dependent enzyme [Streptomyces violaceusniger]|uniref:aminotransferase class III-fold pyridoxal phosphate-dependent enzyme n=1 Tax=Streptomyces violaceusniger TaxID=68280 RepID=UPI0009C1B447|nr:aminotransferase class III [Streptomyces hygroscopicus]